MSIDAIDRAFVARWEQRSAADVPHAVPAAIPPAPAMPAPQLATAGSDVGLDVDAALVERLLATGPEQWRCLADEVEAARLAGHRVIAIAGGERGEGRTTLVACLARVLRDRGRDVVALGSMTTLATDDGSPADGGRPHDKRIVLVDAGVWFPAGPIRRHRLLVASLGCDAAILVRRADREASPARATALAAVGVTALGEVVTFAAAAARAGGDAGDRGDA